MSSVVLQLTFVGSGLVPVRYGIRFQELLTESSSIYLSTVTFWRHGVSAHLEGRFMSVGPQRSAHALVD